MAGRKIELIVEDDEANPAVGLTKSRKLVEKDEVHLMTGGMSAATAYAIAPYIDSKEIPMTYPIMSADDITQRRIPKWIVRTGWSSSQPHQPFGEYAYQYPEIQEGLRLLPTILPSDGNASGGSIRRLKMPAGKSCRRYGFL